MADSELLPMSLMMPSLSNGLSIDTRNPLASFTLQTGPAHHNCPEPRPAELRPPAGPPFDVVARRPDPATCALRPLPVDDQNLHAPSVILAGANRPVPVAQRGDACAGAAARHGHVVARYVPVVGECGCVWRLWDDEQQAMLSFHSPTDTMNPMDFANLSGQVTDFSSAGGKLEHNTMFQIYEQQVLDTARPNRVRALSQIAIPSTPSTGGPLSAPAPSSSQTSSSQRLYIPGQQHFSPNAGSALQMSQHAVPLGLPESPKPNSDWSDDFGLPAWAMPMLYAPSPDNGAGHDQGQCANQS
ncbi:hypothetical protein DFH11DRAFT_1761963 [Phellopilus nigrolimitatus]|nr:hypothetical protein DFH11DRAFT_1761963 [Phellopilus nigrolimitatus]